MKVLTKRYYAYSFEYVLEQHVVQEVTSQEGDASLSEVYKTLLRSEERRLKNQDTEVYKTLLMDQYNVAQKKLRTLQHYTTVTVRGFLVIFGPNILGMPVLCATTKASTYPPR